MSSGKSLLKVYINEGLYERIRFMYDKEKRPGVVKGSHEPFNRYIERVLDDMFRVKGVEVKDDLGDF
jgi:hypothetical protein